MAETLATRNGSGGIEIIDLMVDGEPRTRDQVTVHFSPSFNRKSWVDVDEAIEQIWREKCLANPRLYDASKFRFAGIHRLPGGLVRFKIGATCYKDLMATNCDNYGDQLAARAQLDFGCHWSVCMSDALGTGALLQTSDDRLLFIKRAMWTGEEMGKIDRAGGHPEPDKVTGDSPHRYRDEIFDSVLDEIVSEINVPRESLDDPLLLGIVRSIDRHGRPSAEFVVKCSLTSEEVAHFYGQGTQSEADETTGILFFAKEDLRSLNLQVNILSSLTDMACGMVELYNRCTR